MAVGRATWAVPIGANLVRVSGHEIAHPLVMQLMGNLRPRGSLVSGQLVEVRLWDATTSQAVGSAVSVTSATIRPLRLARRHPAASRLRPDVPVARGGKHQGSALGRDHGFGYLIHRHSAAASGAYPARCYRVRTRRR